MSFITVYNLRALDMFRYGAALENYVAHLLLCAAVVWHYVRPTKRLGPFCIAGATWLLIVGGHPQIMYFGLLSSGIVCLMTPFFARCLLPEKAPADHRAVWKYYLTVGLSVGAGVLLASSYILPFYFEYIQDSARGASTDFHWACSYQDTFAGGLCNFFNPFHSGVCGAFGGSALVLLPALVPLLYLFRVRVPWPMLLLWLLGVVIFVLMLGSNGPLYYYFWKYFPLARTFRVPGRLALLLPFIMLMLLAWMAHLRRLQVRILGRDLSLPPLAALAVIAVVLFAILNGFDPGTLGLQGAYPQHTPAKINEIPPRTARLTVASGLAGLAALVLYLSQRRLSLVAGVVLIAATFMQTTATLRYGTWVLPGPVETPSFKMISRGQKQRLSFSGPLCDPSRLLTREHLERTFLEPTLARVCRKYTIVASDEDVYEAMARQRSIDHVFVENYPATHAEAGPLSSSDAGLDSVKLKYSSFNNLKFDVACGEPGFFVFSYPYSERWIASIDGQRVPTYRANAIEHAVRLSPGTSEVELRYWSWPTVIGVVLSCLGLLSIVFWSLTGLSAGPLRRVVAVAAPCVCVLAFLMWYRSLYSGGNIGTNYVWTSKAIGPNLSSSHNLAYGKRTSMSIKGAVPWDVPYPEHSSLGVDGQRDPRYGFMTNLQDHAWWQVDLGRPEAIGRVVLYKLDKRIARRCLPFHITVSTDASQWNRVETVVEDNNRNRWSFRFQGVTARYVRLQTRYRGYLALAEVEVYGPEPYQRN